MRNHSFRQDLARFDCSHAEVKYDPSMGVNNHGYPSWVAWENSPRYFTTPPTTIFPAKWRKGNEPRNSILMTCHYPDLGVTSDWLKQILKKNSGPFYRYGGHIELIMGCPESMNTIRYTRLVLEIWSFTVYICISREKGCTTFFFPISIFFYENFQKKCTERCALILSKCIGMCSCQYGRCIGEKLCWKKKR